MNPTDKQLRAIDTAHRYITEDGDKARHPKMRTDLTYVVEQVDKDGEVVRMWIAYPNGRLTWKS